MTRNNWFSIFAISSATMAVEPAPNNIDITQGATIAVAAVQLSQKTSTRATLVLYGLNKADAPSPMYQIALKDTLGNKETVGIINFFVDSAPHATKSTLRHFDATSALRALAGKVVAVVIEPISGVIGVAPNISPECRVTIERVELLAQ